MSAVIAIGIAPLIILFSPKILSMLSGIIPFIIIFLITYLLMRENKIVAGIMTFILSGILGYLALNTPVKEPLLPLLSGLFGASGLVMSMKEKTSLTKQNTEAVISANITKKDLIAYTYTRYKTGYFVEDDMATGSQNSSSIIGSLNWLI
jgi:TctA family transporter